MAGLVYKGSAVIEYPECDVSKHVNVLLKLYKALHPDIEFNNNDTFTFALCENIDNDCFVLQEDNKDPRVYLILVDVVMLAYATRQLSNASQRLSFVFLIMSAITHTLKVRKMFDECGPRAISAKNSYEISEMLARSWLQIQQIVECITDITRLPIITADVVAARKAVLEITKTVCEFANRRNQCVFQIQKVSGFAKRLDK